VEIPIIGKKVGRPMIPIEIWEKDLVKKFYEKYRVSADTIERSIEGMRLALEYGKVEQCISYHGAQFMNNMEGYSEFQEFLKVVGIKHIKCKIKHPQSNGKIEKWFECYDNHRKAFSTKEEFLKWYNEVKPHRSLNFEILETPKEAYERKKKVGRVYFI